jgi:hypothetical protein
MSMASALSRLRGGRHPQNLALCWEDGRPFTGLKNSNSCREIIERAAPPGVTGEMLLRFIKASLTEKRSKWLRGVRP